MPFFKCYFLHCVKLPYKKKSSINYTTFFMVLSSINFTLFSLKEICLKCKIILAMCAQFVIMYLGGKGTNLTKKRSWCKMLQKWLESREAKKRKEQNRKLAERHQMYIDDLKSMYESLNA